MDIKTSVEAETSNEEKNIESDTVKKDELCSNSDQEEIQCQTSKEDSDNLYFEFTSSKNLGEYASNSTFGSDLLIAKFSKENNLLDETLEEGADNLLQTNCDKFYSNKSNSSVEQSDMTCEDREKHCHKINEENYSSTIECNRSRGVVETPDIDKNDSGNAANYFPNTAFSNENVDENFDGANSNRKYDDIVQTNEDKNSLSIDLKQSETLCQNKEKHWQGNEYELSIEYGSTKDIEELHLNNNNAGADNVLEAAVSDNSQIGIFEEDSVNPDSKYSSTHEEIKDYLDKDPDKNISDDLSNIYLPIEDISETTTTGQCLTCNNSKETEDQLQNEINASLSINCEDKQTFVNENKVHPANSSMQIVEDSNIDSVSDVIMTVSEKNIMLPNSPKNVVATSDIAD